MKKDFKSWHEKKSRINDIPRPPFFHEREIWFCYVGVNVGNEADGSKEDFLRPILVFRKFNNEIFWALPLTKSHGKIKKETDKYYYTFSFVPEIVSVAMLSQVRLIDAKRLSRHIGTMEEVDFAKLKEKLKALLP